MLIGVKRHADAVPLLARAVVSDPASWQPHSLLAVCLLALGRPRDALAHADRAVSLQPAEEWPHRVRSAALLALRRRIKAVRAAREAVRLDPTEVLAHTQLAHALLGSHRRRAARRAAERAVRLDPSAPHAYNALGVVALSERKNRVAQAAFRKALELDPESPEALNNLGVAVRLEGRVGEAVDLFVSSARIDPRDPAPPQNLSAMSNTLLRMAYVGSERVALDWGYPSGRSSAVEVSLVRAWCADRCRRSLSSNPKVAKGAGDDATPPSAVLPGIQGIVAGHCDCRGLRAWCSAHRRGGFRGFYGVHPWGGPPYLSWARPTDPPDSREVRSGWRIQAAVDSEGCRSLRGEPDVLGHRPRGTHLGCHPGTLGAGA